jgi:hypothetical protein
MIYIILVPQKVIVPHIPIETNRNVDYIIVVIDFNGENKLNHRLIGSQY